MLRTLIRLLVPALVSGLVGCGPSLTTLGSGFPAGAGDAGAAKSDAGNGGGAGGYGGTGGGGGAMTPDASAIDPAAFWANDPPPQWCGPDGGATPAAVPGGTPQCPDDKNRQGCPCPSAGMTANCWPGLRANRGLGICSDGTTTCIADAEFGQVWGACENYVLPDPGATKGQAACRCFSSGQWALSNLSPCFISNSSGQVIAAVSTWVNSTGHAQCPSSITNPPAPQQGTVFSTNTLKVDCAGHFKLCYELKAGTASAPKATDCSMAKVCTEANYPTANQVFAFPSLPAWTSPNPQCAAQFAASGGYGEMSVVGKSVRCDSIDDGSGGSYVFNRVQYCALACNSNPSAPGCAGCSQGGGGTF